MKMIVFAMLGIRPVEVHVCRVQKVHTNLPREILRVWFAALVRIMMAKLLLFKTIVKLAHPIHKMWQPVWELNRVFVIQGISKKTTPVDHARRVIIVLRKHKKLYATMGPIHPRQVRISMIVNACQGIMLTAQETCAITHVCYAL